MIIKLGKDQADWLLLHKAVLVVALPGLAPGLKDGFSRAEKIMHPISGEEIELHTFELSWIDGTYHLDRLVSVLKLLVIHEGC